MIFSGTCWRCRGIESGSCVATRHDDVECRNRGLKSTATVLGRYATGSQAWCAGYGSVTWKRKNFLPVGSAGSGISVMVSVDW